MTLSFDNLRSGFEKYTTEGLTIDLSNGQHLCLSGSSGSGKSSLLKVIAGLQAPKNGTFSYQKESITPKNLLWWRKQIAYLPQQPIMGGIASPQGKKKGAKAKRGGNNTPSVEQVLLLPWELDAVDFAQPSAKECQQALSRFNLTQQLSDKVIKLSGGEKQRLAMARALLMKRPIWLLDEPTSALDIENRDNFIQIIKDLDVIKISVSHDEEWVNESDFVHHLVKREKQIS